jgi:hypothetical protein
VLFSVGVRSICGIALLTHRVSESNTKAIVGAKRWVLRIANGIFSRYMSSLTKFKNQMLLYSPRSDVQYDTSLSTLMAYSALYFPLVTGV